MAATKHRAPFAARVEALVRNIPRGHVATYGQVAARAGHPRAARMVGWILHRTRHDLPWHRVINREGRISIVHEHFTPKTQAILLRKEGIIVTEHDGTYSVDLRTYLWYPDIAPQRTDEMESIEPTTLK